MGAFLKRTPDPRGEGADAAPFPFSDDLLGQWQINGLGRNWHGLFGVTVCVCLFTVGASYHARWGEHCRCCLAAPTGAAEGAADADAASVEDPYALLHDVGTFAQASGSSFALLGL